VRGLSPGAQARLTAHPWPGNIRELKNVLESAVLLSEGEILNERDLAVVPPSTAPVRRFELPPEGLNLAELERDLLL
jgi:DNA-binding NtrC family response regulator